MADKSRAAPDPLSLYRQMQEEPFRFGFYSAVRRIERVLPGTEQLGRTARPKDDVIRFGQTPSMTFAPSTLAEFSLSPGQKPKLDVYFFGLYGPNGPLPLHLTEYVRDRQRNHADHSLARFTDVFHHRFLTFFYRSWADAQPTVNLDRPKTDRFVMRIGSLMGLGLAESRGRDSIPDFAKLHLAARFAQRNRNAEGLCAILTLYFQLPVQLQQFVGQWLPIDREDQLCLGGNPQANQLGLTSNLGSRVWQCQGKFRLIIGPMSLTQYQAFLPGGQSLQRLKDLVRHYLNHELDWDVRLILARQQAKAACLGQSTTLGWTSWMFKGLPAGDLQDLTLEGQA
ncbi:type VI secretion system baseplate subunit TssG [Bowmanella denitrificans]